MRLHHIAAAMIALGFAIPAQASSLSPSAIVDQLSARGYDLRGISCQSGACAVMVHEPGDGITRILVNANNAQPVKNARLGHVSAMVPDSGLTGRDALALVAKAGYGDLIFMSFEDGVYGLKAKASDGTAASFQVDAVSGAMTKTSD